jgi:hypothetical protein
MFIRSIPTYVTARTALLADSEKLARCGSFRIYMEERAVIRFFMLKGLKTRVTHAKLESVYDPEVLALPTMKKWQGLPPQGRTDLFDSPKSGRPLTNDRAGAIGPMLEERPFSSCKVPCPPSGSESEVLAAPSQQPWLEKIPSSLGAVYLIGQPGKHRRIIFEAPSDGPDGTEGEWPSTDHHWE